MHRCCFASGSELPHSDPSIVIHANMTWCQVSVAWLSQFPNRAAEDVWADCYRYQYDRIQKYGQDGERNADEESGGAEGVVPGSQEMVLPPNGSYYCVPMSEQIRAEDQKRADAPKRAQWPGLIALVGTLAVAALGSL